MATFSQCPNCLDQTDGAKIWTCRECGCVHCEKCDSSLGYCPKCGGGIKLAGHIDTSSEHENENARFTECPRCGKNDLYSSIWQCKSCDCIHCEDCDPDNGHCPECGGETKKIGLIE